MNMNTPMIAKRGFRYSGRMLTAGDTFLAAPIDATYLTKVGLADLGQPEVAAVLAALAPAPAPASEPEVGEVIETTSTPDPEPDPDPEARAEDPAPAEPENTPRRRYTRRTPSTNQG